VSLTKRLVASSRERIFAAAAGEFAARGFAGASVDRIARAAHVNKAMIYYHFRSKAALYQEILRDMFAAVAARVADVDASADAPADKIRAFVDAIADAAEARPHFPPIWFREIAEGGAHLDPGTLSHVTAVVKTLGRIVREGQSKGGFARINPMLIHAGIIGPVLMYFASAALRQRLARAGVPGVAQLSRETVVAHVQRVAVMTLEGEGV
jgi:TetR/AcrR family transcriptional regulator